MSGSNPSGPLRQVTIRGDVVQRPRKPWTPTIQSLLHQLYAQGLPVPEPRGYDDQFEYVGLVHGDAGEAAWHHQLTDAGVRSAGALLRRIHDATEQWRPPVDAAWSVPFSDGPVICHGDPQPANLAWRDGLAVGLFDWDSARPGRRLDDVAYGLLWMVPIGAEPDELERRGFTSPPNRRARAEAFLDGYGWTDPINVVDVALERHRLAIDEVALLGVRGDQPHATWVAAGWPQRWRAGLPRMRELSRGFDSRIDPREG